MSLAQSLESHGIYLVRDTETNVDHIVLADDPARVPSHRTALPLSGLDYCEGDFLGTDSVSLYNINETLDHHTFQLPCYPSLTSMIDHLAQVIREREL